MADKDLRVLTSDSYSGPGDAGRTGSWRVLRPVIDYDKCAPAKSGKPSCYFCWVYCPDNVVTKTLRPQVDLTYCKGCGICAEECPRKAITMVEESKFSADDQVAAGQLAGDQSADDQAADTQLAGDQAAEPEQLAAAKQG